MKHSHLKKSVSFIKTNFWPKELATEEAKKEISAKVGYLRLLALCTVWGTIASAITYAPYNFDYEDSPHPFMDFLGCINIPETTKSWLVIILYLLFFPMAYSIPMTGIVMTYYIGNFMIQVRIISNYLVFYICKYCNAYCKYINNIWEFC